MKVIEILPSTTNGAELRRFSEKVQYSLLRSLVSYFKAEIFYSIKVTKFCKN